MSDSLATDLAAWLGENAEIGDAAVYAGVLPESAALAANVIESGGAAREPRHAAQVAVQVFVRGATRAAAVGLARAILEALCPAGSPVRNAQLGDWRALTIDAVGDLVDLGKTDDGHWHQVSINLVVMAYRNAPAVTGDDEGEEP